MLLIAAVVLLFLALALLLTRQRQDDSAVPEGEILYEDISEKRYTSKVLISERYGLRGKPDYLIMTKDGIVPVELKSTLRPPLRGGVHKSHIAQILAYCAMAGESLGERIPYGLVIYRDQVPRRVVPTPKRMAWMEQMTEAVRVARRAESMHRDHGHVERCLNCGVREPVRRLCAKAKAGNVAGRRRALEDEAAERAKSESEPQGSGSDSKYCSRWPHMLYLGESRASATPGRCEMHPTHVERSQYQVKESIQVRFGIRRLATSQFHPCKPLCLKSLCVVFRLAHCLPAVFSLSWFTPHPQPS